MKKIIKALEIPAIILLFITSFVACDKDFYVLESSVLGKDNSNFSTNVDTFPIISYNKKLDSIQINNLPASLLGFYNDPEFGETTASIIAQITPTLYDPDFNTNPVIDSVVLNVPYYSEVTGLDDEGNSIYSISDSLYGNPIQPFKLSIYENGYFLRDFNPTNLDETQNYYSHASNGSTNNYARTENVLINFDDFKGDLINETTFIPSNEAIETWVISDSDTTKTLTAPALRLKLDNAFWQTAIISKQDTPELNNESNFKNYFRGLYFKAEAVNNNGSMALLNFGSTDAKISIHYSYDDDGDQLQGTYTFNFTGNRLNTFINNYSKTLINGDKINGDDELFLKGGEGSMAIINLFDGMSEYTDEDGNTSTLPALEAFKKTYRSLDNNGDYVQNELTGEFILKQLINEAHLVIYEGEVNTGGIEDFHKYDRLYAYDIKNNTPLIDYFTDPIENSTSPVISKIVHLGVRDTVEKKFKIRLTDHLNNILLSDSTNTKIGLVLSSNVNIVTNSEILKSEDVVSEVPTASIIAPRGTVLHGSNSSTIDKRMVLKLFFTKPE
ncbi:DUF4270 domain-containing protein [Seonamhaeicola sp. MEBiC1930]|uniref:DUF4270 domain-containing protein n=1 Tax=Seonamhaeicola sp. MEBiC01930 TaxID=2976768 RepID=UPI003254C669